MSLQVWLPLCGNLTQQGISNIEATNHNTVVNDYGKIGKCMEFTADNSYIELPVTDLTQMSGAFSIVLWVKILSWNTNYATLINAWDVSYSWKNLIFSLLRYSGQNRLCFNIADGHAYTAGGCITDELELDTWYNFACIYEPGVTKLYQDGTLVSSYSTSVVPDFSKITSCKLGQTMNGFYQANCLMNDVRLYDHALTEKEVKEISRGLVLHYPLNDRYVEPTKNMLPIEKQNFVVNGKADAGYYNVTTSESGAYTLSAYIKRETKDDEWSAPRFSMQIKYTDGNTTYNYTAFNNIPKDGKFHYYELTTISNPNKTVQSVYGWMLDHSSPTTTKYVEVCNAQLENKDHATAYTSSERKSSDILVHDISGFSNNGTVTGALSTSSDTVRYKASTYFNGSSYALTDSGSFSWFDFDKCTLSVWMKPTTTPSSWAGTFGIAHNNSSGNKSFVIGNYGGKFTMQSANGGWVNIQSVNLPINEWHHCAATLDGTTIKMYFDGELVNTYTINWGTTTVASDTRVQVGVDLPGSDEIYQGYYSDARIYTIALSANDIQELYAMGVSE